MRHYMFCIVATTSKASSQAPHVYEETLQLGAPDSMIEIIKFYNLGSTRKLIVFGRSQSLPTGVRTSHVAAARGLWGDGSTQPIPAYWRQNFPRGSSRRLVGRRFDAANPCFLSSELPTWQQPEAYGEAVRGVEERGV